MKEYPTGLQSNPTQKGTGGQGTPPLPCLRPFTSVCKLPRGAGQKPAYGHLVFMPARRKFEVRARMLTLEAMHHPL